MFSILTFHGCRPHGTKEPGRGVLPILLMHTWVINLETQSSHSQASHRLADLLEGEPGLAKEDLDGQCAAGS